MDLWSGGSSQCVQQYQTVHCTPMFIHHLQFSFHKQHAHFLPEPEYLTLKTTLLRRGPQKVTLQLYHIFAISCPKQGLTCPLPAVTTLKAGALGSSLSLYLGSLSPLISSLFCCARFQSPLRNNVKPPKTTLDTFPALPLHTFHAPR
jgi:hypothetical protein